ncbi:hypothetical protein JGS22_009795 [Streptomyces sp. P38-E01]|uniref:Uncharacterized protein n=1 Tax=Streptomyces tardus TaxID=2780544 RepID=A0A949JG07_9ACTN|nr:hypothetical protein [Streptomyces tardus]MBU7597900.1 hypothetical protein [Streptomyces tardus]
MNSQRDDQPHEPDGNGDSRDAAQTETRGARRLRESGALFIIFCALVQLTASVSKVTGDDNSEGLTGSPQGMAGVALAVGAITSAILAWRNRVSSWLLLGATLVIAHVVLFQVLAD